MFDPESDTFVVHVALLSFIALPSSFLLNIHPFQIEQRLILHTQLFIVYIYVLARKIFRLGIYLRLSTC